MRNDRSLPLKPVSNVKPHVLLLTCHDLGRHLNCYGVETVGSMYIDGLAEEGVLFTRAFSTASSCSPARAALATGRYPHSNGMMGLGGAGYETHLFGLQHVSPVTERLGFEHVHPFQEKALSHEVTTDVNDFLKDWCRRRSNRPTGRLSSRRGSNRPTTPLSGKPLYLEVNLEPVHRPFGQGGVEPDVGLGLSVPPYLPQDVSSGEEMAQLQGAVRQVDFDIGKTLETLAELDLLERTLVIFTTDHGLAMPRAKCTLYDPGIETALVMCWVNELPRGQVLHEMVSNIDVLPTLLELVGVRVPEAVQGRSLAPLLRGGPYTGRTHIFAEKTFHSYYDPMRAVRTERFKYIRNFESAFAVEVPGDVQEGRIFRDHVELYHRAGHPAVELFDLEADPLEQKNLAADEEYAEEGQSLDQALRSWMEETNDLLLQGPVASPFYREALRF